MQKNPANGSKYFSLKFDNDRNCVPQIEENLHFELKFQFEISFFQVERMFTIGFFAYMGRYLRLT